MPYNFPMKTCSTRRYSIQIWRKAPLTLILLMMFCLQNTGFAMDACAGDNSAIPVAVEQPDSEHCSTTHDMKAEVGTSVDSDCAQTCVDCVATGITIGNLADGEIEAVHSGPAAFQTLPPSLLIDLPLIPPISG